MANNAHVFSSMTDDGRGGAVSELPCESLTVLTLLLGTFRLFVEFCMASLHSIAKMNFRASYVLCYRRWAQLTEGQPWVTVAAECPASGAINVCGSCEVRAVDSSIRLGIFPSYLCSCHADSILTQRNMTLVRL